MRPLLTPDGAYDRKAIMAKAHSEFWCRRRFGDVEFDWSAALAYAWRVARGQRDIWNITVGESRGAGRRWTQERAGDLASARARRNRPALSPCSMRRAA
jgi:hypothetical protein